MGSAPSTRWRSRAGRTISSPRRRTAAQGRARPRRPGPSIPSRVDAGARRRKRRHGEQDGARSRARPAGTSSRLGPLRGPPRAGTRWERLVIEREAELLRNEAEPANGVARDVRQAPGRASSVLLDLTGHDGAPVRRAQRLEAAGGACERADGEVPPAVGGDERAAVHDAAVAQRPRQDGHETRARRRRSRRGPESAGRLPLSENAVPWPPASSDEGRREGTNVGRTRVAEPEQAPGRWRGPEQRLRCRSPDRQPNRRRRPARARRGARSSPARRRR